MIRVLVVDDHALIREGLRKVFRRESDIEVVGEACNAAEAVAMVRETVPDVVVMDFTMPGRSGLDAMQQIHQVLPRLPVLILSMQPEDKFALRVLKAGGAGFVSKDGAAENIVDAVRKVASGGKYVGALAAEQMAMTMGKSERATGHEALSNRELQIVHLIAAGKGTRLISVELSLSVNTIATYRRRILEKLQLKSDVDITRYAIDHKLLS